MANKRHPELPPGVHLVPVGRAHQSVLGRAAPPSGVRHDNKGAGRGDAVTNTSSVSRAKTQPYSPKEPTSPPVSATAAGFADLDALLESAFSQLDSSSSSDKDIDEDTADKAVDDTTPSAKPDPSPRKRRRSSSQSNEMSNLLALAEERERKSQSLNILKARVEQLLEDSESEDEQPRIRKCPFCNRPIPQILTEPIQKSLDALLADPELVAVPDLDNPDAKLLSITKTRSFCRLHRLEYDLIPLARRNGWPLDIAFDTLEARIDQQVPHLKRIINHETPSTFLKRALALWKEKGAKANTWAGQMGSFEVEHPGYFGGMGREKMYLRIMELFVHERPDSAMHLTHADTHPMRVEDFVRRVLVPECALSLIREDMDCDSLKARQIYDQSREYGNMMFVSKADVRISADVDMTGTDDDSDDHTYGRSPKRGTSRSPKRSPHRKKLKHDSSVIIEPSSQINFENYSL